MKKFYSFLIGAFILSALFTTNSVFGQIAQRGTPTSANSTNTSLTINKPTGVVAGDVMLVNIGQRNNGTNAPTLAGWTLISSGAIDGGSTLGAVLYKVAGASEPASYTFVLGSGANNNTGTIVAFSGVDVSGATPFDVAPGAMNLSGSAGNAATATGLTTVGANAAIVMFTILDNNSALSNWNTTNPGTLTELYENQYNPSGNTDLTTGAAWAIKPAVGATGNGTVTIGSSVRWGALMVALKYLVPTPTATLSPSATQNVAVGGTISFTATANNYGGSGNYTFTWTAAGATGWSNVTQASNTLTQTLTFPSAGIYTVSVSIARTGAGTLSTNTTTVNVLSNPGANLWATSSSGTQISSFSVSNGVYFAGPTNIFAPTFPGTTTGGTSTAALGRNDKPTQASGYFYWLPNTSGNNGVVEVFGATAAGGTPTRIGSLDLNGGSTNNLGFVRLGMGPDGTGWILAGDGTTLFLAKFLSNALNPVTISIEDASVSLVGGAAATFQNGDICISGTGNIYALANDGAGVTQIFTGFPTGSTTTLTKKLDLEDGTGTPFTGSVNGVAFDALGSLYISTADGLYYINQATVNGPAATVSCVLVHSVTGLQDLASNVFPTQSTLPVKLESFTVAKQGTNAILNWITQTEINSDHFEIERSTDGVNFSVVGTKQASLNSTFSVQYQYLDPIGSASGIIYYRLKTVDIDSKADYSKIVALRLGTSLVKDITVYPNPFSNSLKIEMNSDKESNVTIRINNMAGQQVYTRNMNLQKGNNVIVLSNELKTLNAGMHILEVITEDGKTIQKIIKR